MSKQSAEAINTRLVELEQALQGKELETKKLYKMVNMYKEQITQLEIKTVDQQIVIESLQQIIQEGRQKAVPEDIVEDLGDSHTKEVN